MNHSVKTTLLQNALVSKAVGITTNILTVPALVTVDGLAITASMLLAFYFRAHVLRALLPAYFPEKLLAGTFNNIWWFPLVVLFCLFYENLYQKRHPFWKEVEQIFKAITLAILFTIVLLFMAHAAYQVSRVLIIIIWVFLVLMLPLFRYYSKLVLAKLGIWKKPVLIIGAGKTACLIAQALNREKTMGYKAIGILNDRGDLAETADSPAASQIPILGNVGQAKAIIASTGVQDVFIAMPSLPAEQTVKLTNHLQSLVKNVMLVPDLFGLSQSGIETQHFFEEQVLMLNIKNRLKPFTNRAVKRTFDLFFGSILLLLCTPLLLSVALAIKLESRGPVFFNNRRIGQGGKIFNCHKFRTMYVDADQILEEHLAGSSGARVEWEEYRKLISYDPRLTGIGAFLRRFSLDELPQLINVVCGEMSLVGPRPYLPKEKDLMGDWYEEITVAKPGMTGLWQVSGRNMIDFEGRMKLGAWYVKNWSLWLDIVLIIRTFKVVLKGEGAY